MIYLSKGIVQKGSTEQLLFVLYGGQKFELTGNAAAAWLNGRFKFAEALGRNEPPVAYLQKLGLSDHIQVHLLSDRHYRTICAQGYG